jgi:hypothetical protein
MKWTNPVIAARYAEAECQRTVCRLATTVLLLFDWSLLKHIEGKTGWIMKDLREHNAMLNSSKTVAARVLCRLI